MAQEKATKIYSPSECMELISRIGDEAQSMSELETYEMMSIMNELATKLDAFWEKHDKLKIMSINFDV